jgi:hypothetical protein
MQNDTFLENIKLTPKRIKKKFGKALVDKNKLQLSFLFRKNFIKRRRRNIRKISKIITSLSIKDPLQILKVVSTFG